MSQTPTQTVINAVDMLPKRTTPTWEMEILLSGATVFALFQAYAELNVAAFWLIERLPGALGGLLSPIGLYMQGALLALALGFLGHLILRAAWVSLVGLHSVDPEGRLRHNENLGPTQRALLGEALDALPIRIATLDDVATIVFGAALGVAKMMAMLMLAVGSTVALAFLGALLLDMTERTAELGFGLVSLWLAPLMVATLWDNHAGKRSRPAPVWIERILRAYAALGLTADGNLGLTAATYRVAGMRRGWRAQAAIALVVAFVVTVTLATPALQNKGVGGLLDGDFPAMQAGDTAVLQANHYLDRQQDNDAQYVPSLPGDVLTEPYARLFIPYVPDWHDVPLDRCASRAGERWLTDAAASRAVLDCLAAKQPIMLDGRPVAASWWWSTDARRDRRGFQVMIDLRALAPGAHLLEVARSEAERRRDGDDAGNDDAPWHIPFWR